MNTKEAQSILTEINKLRDKPSVYVEHLNEYIENLSDGCLNISGVPFSIALEEGPAVLTETLKYLRNHKGGLPPLQLNKYLYQAAQDHLDDIGPRGITSHVSSDKKTSYKERVEKHSAWGGCLFEAMMYGYHRPTAQDVVLNWLIDDGFKKRQHRQSLLCENHKEFAIV